MDNRIKVLDTILANKIAAGEVIERPSSVIKELIENSIDALSSMITVEIIEGGKRLIKITDNGIGIDKDDVELAFIRHATSKIKEEVDLYAIGTLGFRGEALSSIAAVSKVAITTKTDYCDWGVKLEIKGGQVISKKEVGCPRGTTIVVEDLFFNTPARNKYLKSSSAETTNITDVVQGLALGNPNIAFKLYNNGKLTFHSPGNGDLISTAVYVLGKETCNHIISFREKDEVIQINGIVSKPEISKGNRSNQFIFVNGRLISSTLISRAIEDSYKELLTVGRYPIFVVNVGINPELTDVNIHPTKANIRLWNDNDVYSRISRIIKNILKSNLEVSPIGTSNINSIMVDNASKTPEDVVTQIKISSIVEQKINTDKLVANSNFPDTYSEKTNQIYYPKKHQENNTSYSNTKDESVIVKEELYESKYSTDNISYQEQIRIVGQILNTYIIAEGKESIYLIDQHAAHERITYEKLLEQYNNSELATQTLLYPIVINLSNYEAEKVIENKLLFSRLGFNIEEFGQNSYIVREVPFILGKPYAQNFLMSIVDSLCNGNFDLSDDKRMNQIISMACKASVKANDSLSEIEIKELISSMFRSDNPYNCPHGRPTTIQITKYQLEKMFKRVL